MLDLGIITAGAATSALLADLGAEVIKIESPSYRDPFRSWLPGQQSEQATLPPFFRATNRGKFGVSIDLKREAGRDLFLRLVRASDIVVENFRRGVLARLGLDYAALKAVNPDIILASISSQGEDGPEAGYVSYGSTLEAVAGLAWTTGYSDGAPVISGVDLNYPDQIVALFASSMVVTAWHARQNGAGGAHLDLSQRELTSYLCGDAFVAETSGTPTVRSGNAQAPYLLQDCFKTADARWLAVTIAEGDLTALETVLGASPDPAGETLRVTLASWAGDKTAETAAEALRGQGIAAAAVLTGPEVYARSGSGWTHALTTGPGGAVVKGFPFQFDQEPLTIGRDAPGIGADSVEILQRVAGLSRGEIERLREHNVIEAS